MLNLITLLGPTASGKTRLAALLASRLDAEIISADSRQVYRGMNIGTGKDYDDYVVDNQSIKYHLIDIVDAGESYHIAKFQRDFQEAYQTIQTHQKTAILCGGSGMYIDAILRDYEFTQVPVNQELRAELEQKTYEELIKIFKETPSSYSDLADISTKKRLIRAIEIGYQLSLRRSTLNVEDSSVSEASNGEIQQQTTNIKHQTSNVKHQTTNNKHQTSNIKHQTSNIKHLSSNIFGINLPTELRRERITKRLYARLQNGLVEEVEMLLKSGISPEKLIFYGLEYKFITQYLTSQLTYNQAVMQLEIAIHQFAKRQMTYFRGMERKGLKINWIDGTKSSDEMLQVILEFLKKNS